MPAGRASARAARTGRCNAAARFTAALTAYPAAAALPGAAGMTADGTVRWVGLKVGAHPAAAGLPGGARTAGEWAAAAIGNAAALPGVTDRLRGAAVARHANLIVIAGVIADTAIFRIGLAIGANIPAAGQSIAATFARCLATELRGAARRPAADIPSRAAHRATTGLLARAALSFAAVTPAWATAPLTADLTGSARRPILPAGRRGRSDDGYAGPVLADLPDFLA